MASRTLTAQGEMRDLILRWAKAEAAHMFTWEHPSRVDATERYANDHNHPDPGNPDLRTLFAEQVNDGRWAFIIKQCDRHGITMDEVRS